MGSIRGWIGKTLLAVFGATALVACVAPQPDPYYYAPGYYGYAPGYYAPPRSTFVFSYQGGHRHHRHHGHRHHHRW